MFWLWLWLLLDLALAANDWRHCDRQPHQHGARRQAPSRALLEAIIANLIFGALLAWHSS
jgi:hypothetical protein